jgi:hypothetical protein
LFGLQKGDSPNVDLDGEFKILLLGLSHKTPDKLLSLLDQFKKIASRTHSAVAIQDPNVKTKTKGRPAAKKDCLTSTKRNPLAFELAEAKIKCKDTTRKRVLNSNKGRQSKRVKTSGGNKNIEENTSSESSSNNWKGSDRDHEEGEYRKIEEKEENKAVDEEKKPVIKSLLNGGVTELVKVMFLISFCNA